MPAAAVNVRFWGATRTSLSHREMSAYGPADIEEAAIRAALPSNTVF
jgi:hypothetical protein